MNNVSDHIETYFLSHTAVFLHAHPDDESFLSAGLINQLVSLKRNCFVVYCAASLVDGMSETVVRQREAFKACSLLGINPPIFLGFCDAKYAKNHARPLINQNVGYASGNLWENIEVKKVKLPICLVSYDQNGGYGNHDHRVVHAIGRSVQKEHGNI